MPGKRLWDLAHEAILTTGVHDVTVMSSSHSVDIVAAGVSKLNVVRRLRKTVGDEPILAIGDHGRWPGNDMNCSASRLHSGSTKSTSIPQPAGISASRGSAVRR